MNESTRTFVFWFLIIGILSLGIYLVFFINSESFNCIKDPYVYSIKLLEKANNGDVTCLCSVNNPRSPLPVILNETGFFPFKK